MRIGTSANPRPSRTSFAQQDYSAGEGIVEESFNRGSYLGDRGSDAPSVPSLIFLMRYFPFISFGVWSILFEDEMFLRREDFVTPRPERVYST